MTTELRTSQVEVLRPAKQFGGEIKVWQAAEKLRSDNWLGLETLGALAKTGHLEALPPAAMADSAYGLTQLGHEALEGEG